MAEGRASFGGSAPVEAPDTVAVLLPLPLGEAYDYATPPALEAPPGSFVAVPLGPREVVGVVWGRGTGRIDPARLKPVAAVLAVPPLPAASRAFVDWVAAYVMSPPGAVLRMAMSVSAALEPPRPVEAVALPPGPPPAGLLLTPARRRVLALLADGPPRPVLEVARDAGCGTGVVRGLLAAGALERVSLLSAPPAPAPDPSRPGPALEPDQAAAAADLAEKARAGGFSVTLLDGVTGSGKTEVYLEAVAAALAAGRQALVLLPEIALSAQWLTRFAARFGAPPDEWHSDLSGRRRRATWRRVALGQARVVVGARSALFLPFGDLGLIVVDEEHEAAYKQEDGVLYHARDMAVVRARLGGHPVVLVSATPSLETVVNAERGRYARLALPARHGGATMPPVDLVDLRLHRPARGSFLSPPLEAALAQTLAAGEQAMLFLNRRGYAPLTLCRACGHRFECPNCTAWLVEHRLTGRLHCHHCGLRMRLPAVCPACGAEGSLVACGPGVERIGEEVAARLPQARTLLMTSDLIHGPAAAAALIHEVEAHAVDLVIGTQLVAKGHHFPMLTLVGVVDADLGLAGGDLRAAERTFQLLHQVAGRAGRADRPGRVLLQTHLPDHPVMQALARGDRDGFLAAEAAARRRRGLPPFGRLAALILSAPDARGADAAAAALARAVPLADGVTVLGPAPAPLTVLRGRHRRRFLVKGPRGIRLQPLIAGWLAAVRLPANVRITVDIDPYSFL